MRKILSLFLLMAMCCTSTVYAGPASNETGNQNAVPALRAEAALLMDIKTGRVLYSKNENERLYPASTTKIITAILALEKGNLSDVVTATNEAIDPITREDSHMGIIRGEQLTLEQLVNGMLIYSANDAANCIAVHIGGSLSNFVQMMNDKAKELGAVNTHFANPHGFHNDEHYTTASDLAAIARYAMAIPKFREIVATPIYHIPPTNKYTTERVLPTTNHLISKNRSTKYYYPAATGIKTGFTSMAGNCLVASAEKDGTEFLTVVLKSPAENGQTYSFVDTRALLDYAFTNYKYQKIAFANDVIADSAVYEAKNATRVALTVTDDVGVLLPVNIDLKTAVTKNITLKENIKAPIAAGDALGTVSYSYQGSEIATAELVAANEVKRDYILMVIHTIIRILTSPFFLIPLAALIILLIVLNYKRRQRRKKRRNKLSSYPRY